MAHPTGFLLKNLRNLSAVMGALCVLFVGILGWRMGGSISGITASLLTCCCVTLFQDSLYRRLARNAPGTWRAAMRERARESTADIRGTN